MAGRMIVLHGASSAGKSTLARALQAAAPLPLLHLSFDTIRDTGALPWGRFQAGDFDWARHRVDIFNGLHAAIAGFAAAGADLVVEHILDWPAARDEVEAAWRGLDCFWVGVHTPLDVLECRELARGDRVPGSAAADFRTVHRGLHYDLEVDGTLPARVSAAQILDAWLAARA